MEKTDLSEIANALLVLEQRIPPTVSLVTAALLEPTLSGARLAYDLMRDSKGGNIASIDKDNWRPITSEDIVELRIKLEQKLFTQVPDKLLRDALLAVWTRNRGLWCITPLPETDLAFSLLPEDFIAEEYYFGPPLIEHDTMPPPRYMFV